MPCGDNRSAKENMLLQNSQFKYFDGGMKKFFLFGLIACSFVSSSGQSWIRINQLGYPPGKVKVAVLCSKHNITDSAFYLVDTKTKRIVFAGKTKFLFGSYGPFKETCRLDFSAYQKKGSYFLRAADAISPVFSVDDKIFCFRKYCS